MTIRALTSNEIASLQTFAAHYGRSWKRKLAEHYWYNARTYIDRNGLQHSCLHALRNDPQWGHAGLDAYRLPKPDCNASVDTLRAQLQSLQVQPAGETTINGHRVSRSAIYWYVDGERLTLTDAVARIANA